MKALLIASLLLLMAGCIHTGRYSHRNDSAPTQMPQNLELSAAQPHYVQTAPANSRPYTVFGKEYFPMHSAKGYEAEGEASWYGQKFHGHLTANGEIYNMYHMTAAHRTLPLPSFVRVTNLSNGVSTIVKVNDRGPFHDNRVIDLSWAAAKKLDILQYGTARVKLQVIHVDEDGLMTIGKGPESEPEEELKEPQQMANASVTIDDDNKAQTNIALEQETKSETATATIINEDASKPASDNERATFIQVATLSNSQKVEELARGLSFLFHLPTQTPKTDAGTQIRLGPIQDGVDIQGIIKQLREKGFRDAFKVNAAL